MASLREAARSLPAGPAQPPQIDRGLRSVEGVDPARTGRLDARREFASEPGRSLHQTVTRSLMQSTLFEPSPDATSSSSPASASAAWRSRRCSTSGFSRRRCEVRSRRGRRTSRQRPRTSSICSWPALRRSSICSITSRHCRSTTVRRFRPSSSPRASASLSSRAPRGCSVHRSRSNDTANPARSSPSCCRISATIADDIAIVRSVHTTQFNHAPGQIFMNTGSQVFGRPSMGSWLTYGLGSESHDLPGLHRAALGRERARRRKVVLGQRIPADGLPGRRVPIEEAIPVLFVSNPPRASTAPRARVDRSGDRPRTSCIAPKSAIPRSIRASRRTRWRTGCRPACRS